MRDASHISQEITELLEDLDRLLDEVIDLFAEDQPGESGDDLNKFLEESFDNSPKTELQHLFKEVAIIMRCLYQMAVLVRNLS